MSEGLELESNLSLSLLPGPGLFLPDPGLLLLLRRPPPKLKCPLNIFRYRLPVPELLSPAGGDPAGLEEEVWIL